MRHMISKCCEILTAGSFIETETVLKGYPPYLSESTVHHNWTRGKQ